ncbi:MAG: 5-formyltetrahydrofolate cyclo-ligase [Syntrophomonadaceae bacterium]|nr:5-formyltetrahydrofolate cyclo-ligase [Syntrophomonadaceae bacterium]
MEEQGAKRRALRKQMSERRAGLSSDQVAGYSRLISRKLSQLEPLHKARSIMGYACIGNEVGLDAFWEEQAQLGKTIFLPRVEQGDLAVVEFTGWQHTRPGVFSIREPVGTAVSFPAIDVVIVPALVFDGHGFRLGYGRGYYDRFLKGLSKNTFICGVGYDFQVVDNIYPHAGDVAVHWIVTEKSELAVDWDFF